MDGSWGVITPGGALCPLFRCIRPLDPRWGAADQRLGVQVDGARGYNPDFAGPMLSRVSLQNKEHGGDAVDKSVKGNREKVTGPGEGFGFEPGAVWCSSVDPAHPGNDARRPPTPEPGAGV